MLENKLCPEQVLNKVFLKAKPDQESFDGFKSHVTRLLDQINEGESEEFHKNLVSEFLKTTYYSAKYSINTKGRNDLVIHHGKTAKTPVGVIIEAKRPTNRGEMPKLGNLNTKALQELLLYFLRERITGENLGVRHLVVTNVYEWFIFDAKLFDSLFAQDRELIQKFNDFERGQLSGDKTKFFYREIAKPAIAKVMDQIKFTHFDLREYRDVLNNGGNDRELIALFKLLSPEHLFKLPVANDSNRLNKPFYNELLYIIGLAETKEKGKKLIGRVKDNERQGGSLLENAMGRLESLGKLSRLMKPEEFGETEAKRLFNVALRLAINWINRILFLKLLEAQLIKYHQGNQDFAFLNLIKVKSYDDLDCLFFDVLAKETDKREARVKEIFGTVPYLNSSLFEPTETEQETIVISNLQDRSLPIFGATVLKDDQGKRRSGELNTLQYLFEFLAAYDFSSDELKEGQDDSEKLINASVLGLIFEKINGYKDGSFYTPSFITMYMCRETIRRAVVQKFNEVKGWNCQNIRDLKEDLSKYIIKEFKDRTTGRNEANEIFNSLKICDPAVGSGHFLVSALNEIIAIKQYLGILQDRHGEVLSQYEIEVVNDKLKVTLDNKLFAYNPKNKESQRVQETLFHEKQKIIEGCLFGVDINPNSVKICQLRLWIELLKNAYYRIDGNLETLPNIDINIKEGNSLISRFGIHEGLGIYWKSQKDKFIISRYKESVKKYFNSQNKADKIELEKEIIEIKKSFKGNLLFGVNSSLIKKRNEIKLTINSKQLNLLSTDKKSKDKDQEKEKKALIKKLEKVNLDIEDIKKNTFYNRHKAFEWRFEFPDVLNDQGEFVGFDIVIGNPPYIRQEEIKDQKQYLQAKFSTYSGTADLYVFFVEKGFEILKPKGQFCYIMPNKWMQAGYGKALRKYFLNTQLQAIIDFGDLQVFEEATTYPCILNASKENGNKNFISAEVKTLNYSNEFTEYLGSISNIITSESLSDETWMISSGDDQDLLLKIKSKCISLADYVGGEAHYGIKTGLTEAFLIDNAKKKELIIQTPKCSEVIKPILQGRDIKKYLTPYTDKHILFIPWHFPLQSNPNIKGASTQAELSFKKDYLSIYNHLSAYKEKLEKRNSAETGIRYEWYAMQRYASDYYQEFEKPKIMYQKFQVKPCFIYDDQGLYCNDSMWFISKDDKILLAILNSNMGWWLISKYCTAIQNGYQLIWKYFGKIPIPKANSEQAKLITSIVDEILTAKKSDPNADTSQLETAIDHLVYKLYNLTYEEIKIIDPDFALTPEEYTNLAIK